MVNAGQNSKFRKKNAFVEQISRSINQYSKCRAKWQILEKKCFRSQDSIIYKLTAWRWLPVTIAKFPCLEQGKSGNHLFS